MMSKLAEPRPRQQIVIYGERSVLVLRESHENNSWKNWDQGRAAQKNMKNELLSQVSPGGERKH